MKKMPFDFIRYLKQAYGTDEMKINKKLEQMFETSELIKNLESKDKPEIIAQDLKNDIEELKKLVKDLGNAFMELYLFNTYITGQKLELWEEIRGEKLKE